MMLGTKVAMHSAAMPHAAFALENVERDVTARLAGDHQRPEDI